MKSNKFKFMKPYLTKEDKIKLSLIKGLAIGIVIAIIIGVYSYKIAIPKAIKNAKEEERNKIIGSLKKTYILNKDVAQGTKITDKDVILVDMDKNNIPANAILNLSDIEGKIARINLPNKSVLYSSVLVKEEDNITDDLRLQDYKHIVLGEKLQKDQYIDVRIKRPDGTDEIVLCKKKVKDIAEKTIFINLAEAERQVFNAATVEADYVKGILYTTTYVNPENQAAAVRTYKPDAKFLKIIKENEKMVQESMQRLEEKVRQLESENQVLRGSYNNAYTTTPEQNNNNIPQNDTTNSNSNTTPANPNSGKAPATNKPVIIGR